MSLICRISVLIAVALHLVCTAAVNAASPEVQTGSSSVASLSLQGFSGILNTPTGHVQEVGTIAALYSKQKDVFGLRTAPRQENYLVSVGLFNFAEVGGRLTDAQSLGIRDLSANAKVTTAPFTAHLPFAPVFALGLQDMGGGATFLRTSYLAASADPFSWMRVSAGYGRGPDRMDGAFGGVELKAHKWVSLLGEYDTKDTNVGIRLIAPPLPYLPASLTLTAKSSLNDSSHIDIAFGLTLPLDMKKAAATPLIANPAEHGQGKPENDSAVTPPPAPATSLPSPVAIAQDAHLNAIRTRLIAAGFANVRIGVMGGTVLVVEYENVRYNHNELDAMGIVAGIASAGELKGIEALWMVVKRKGLRVMWVSTPLKEMRAWLSEPGGAVAAPSLQVDYDTSPVDTTRFIAGDSNPDWLRPSLILYPGLKTFVGTEVGVFDYLLSIKPELQVTVWKGAVLNARWDVPVSWSHNFDDYQTFAYARNAPVMDRLMLFQGLTLAPGLIANLGVGMIQHNTNGTLNELDWSPGSGMHRFRVAQAFARNSDTRADTKVLLGSYRLYLAPLDLFLEGTVGKFWGQDTGGVLSLKRFFGDTAVDVYFKDTASPENRRWKVAGMAISFPLTPRRDMQRSPLQVRGTEEWGYGQETVLAVNGQKSNDTISASFGVIPLPSPGISRSYLNRDRLNDDYMQAHKGRLKEAWVTFRNDLESAMPKY
ncbi:MAG: YjbH domain-containing protein [Desulfuromonadales bacterium]